MMPTDDRLKRELAQGPLKRSGFDDRLRMRIEERLDEGPPRRAFRPYRLAGMGMALCFMVFAAVLLFRLQPTNTDNALQTADTSEPEAIADAAGAADANEAHRRTVLLLGLRQDGADGEASTYRTVLISGGPDPSDWSAAEGEGIIMPHRTDFWRLNVVESRGDGSLFRLAQAWNASRGEMAIAPPSPMPASSVGLIEERILFAGNRYIAIARRTGGEWTHRMMEITDLAQPRNAAAIAAGSELQVSLQEKADGRIGVAEAEGPGYAVSRAWTFSRKGGLWMAFGREASAASPDGPAVKSGKGYVFDASLVAHNELALSWKYIRDAQPAAFDAVTSPIRNMAVILTDKNIVIYSMRGGKLEREMLRLGLRPGETVIMAEWATNAAYVDGWISRVTELFEGRTGRRT